MKIGDNVFLLKGDKIKKLDNHYTEPYEVLEVLRKGNVKISYRGYINIYTEMQVLTRNLSTLIID